MLVSNGFARVFFALLTLAGCAGTELEVSNDHPGHPGARSGRLFEAKKLEPVRSPSAKEAADAGANHAGHRHGTPAPPAPGMDAAPYTCPMHSEVVSEAPGQCPRCGMKLEPKKAAK